MVSVIYSIKCKQSKKQYIGSAVNYDKRKRHHLDRLHNKKHHNIHLQRAWDKYGEQSFYFEIMEEVEDTTIILEREQCYIDNIGMKNLYNINPTAGSNLGRKFSEKTRKLISDKVKGRKVSEKTKELHRKISTGKKHTEKTKEVSYPWLKPWASAETDSARLTPSLSMFSAALRSLSRTRPQCGQLCMRSESVFGTTAPHPEHICEVPLAGTLMNVLPASSAL
jgi:hypothetical protein